MTDMKKFFAGLVVVGLGFAGTCLTAAAASSKTDLDGRLDAATRVINEVMATPDKAIPNQITEKATCIGVVPSMKKAAFLVGGQYGQGVVTCRTPHGWSAPVFFRIAGGSFGFQIGGQATDLVLVAVNDKGFQDLLKNKVKLGGDAAAFRWSRRPQCRGRHRLEAECGTIDLFAFEGTVRRYRSDRR